MGTIDIFLGAPSGTNGIVDFWKPLAFIDLSLYNLGFPNEFLQQKQYLIGVESM